jgi:hypothetical protein
VTESKSPPKAVAANPASPTGDLRLLTAYIVLIIVVPSRLIFGPLGAAGTPAGVLGVVMALVWGLSRVSGARPKTIQPVPVAMTLFVVSVFISYIVAATRPIDAAELSAADRGILTVISWSGVLLIATYRPVTLRDLDVVLRRLSIGGAVLASVGLAQFVTGRPLTNYIQIPGLRINSDLVGVLGRAGLTRPAGTALHPIEFGAALTLILPIAIHYALYDRHRNLLLRWCPVIAIGLAVPISISRSAVVSSLVVLLVLLPTWSVGLRRRAYAGVFLLTGTVYMLVPGLLGTIRNLFTNISGDSSAASRTGSYSLAWTFISRAPFFGRGFWTFQPTYRILDDQYLGLLIDIGCVGLLALLGLFATSIITARRARRRSTDPATRNLAQSLAAGVASAACSLALYDGFSFPMASGLLFLVIGCAAALRRLVYDASDIPVSRPAALSA